MKYFKEKQDEFNKEFRKSIIRNKKGIQLSSNETKLKVLAKIDEIFRTQERVLIYTTEGFNF